MLINKIKEQGDKPFAVFTEASLSYSQLLLEIKKITFLFRKKNIEAGDKVILSLSHDLDVTIFTIAALVNGVVVIFLDSTVKKERAGSIIRAAQPKGFIIEDRAIEEWNLKNTSTTILVKRGFQKKGRLFEKLLKKRSEVKSAEPSKYFPENVEDIDISGISFPDNIPDDSIAYVLYTSGTTSDNKGVLITRRNLFSHLETLKKVYKLSAEDRILNILNLYHADGIVQGPLLSLFSGATLYRPFTFEINKINEIFYSIYRLRITHAFLVPAILSLMDKFSEGFEDSFQTPDFKFIISVSSHIESALWKRFSEKFKTRIVNVYGLTETVTGGLFCGPDDESYRVGTIGKPVDCETRIIGNKGNELEAEQEGELLLRGLNIMKGYLNNPEATQLVLKDGWLYTGDLAIKDTEGFYRITGRKKNIVISGGFNISPEEVTEIINLHPDVMESISLGIPDEIFGERLVSCVVVKENSGCNEIMIAKHCRENLEPEKVPSRIVIVNVLPKGVSGKIKIEEVRSNFFGSDKMDMEGSSDVLDALIDMAAVVFRVDKSALSLQSNSYNVSGWDSLSHLSLVNQLEKKYQVSFNTAEVMTMNSLAGIERIIKNKLVR